MRAIIQTLQVIRIIAAFPAIEGLRRDAKVTTGEPGITAMRVIIVKPF
jgi:hypothetical protein